jgi:hypothetical protein
LDTFYKMCLLFIFISFFQVSCKEAERTDTHITQSSGIFNDISERIKAVFRKELSVYEYINWVKDQQGVTCDSVGNDHFSIQLTLNPPQLEAYMATVNNGENPKSEFSKYLSIQKNYYYCTVNCIAKDQSVNKPVDKNELLQSLKQNLLVVKNHTDTLFNVITEPFISYVMNQPNKLLVLIPRDDASEEYIIKIKGAAYQLRDCQLSLSKEDIQSFPSIKL